MEKSIIGHRLQMTAQQLRDHARWLGEHHHIEIESGEDVLLSRLEQNESLLLKSYRVTEEAARSGLRVVPAAMWLLDNFYLLEEQIWLARKHLPKSYSKQLPRAKDAAGKGYPRVYELVLELITCVDGLIDESSIDNFVDGYQEASQLKIGELWAVPLMMRFALVQTARHTAARIATGTIDRHNANRWADRVAALPQGDSSALLQLMAELTNSNPRMSMPFLAELTRRLQNLYPVPALPMSWIEDHLAARHSTLDSLFQNEGQQEAIDQVSMSHVITSLRLLESIDWRQFVENRSVLESTLAQDPMGVYKSMDFATRDCYRHNVERLAKRYNEDETTVAYLALNFARSAQESFGATDRRSHIGFYLIGRGRERLDAALSSGKRIRFSIEQFFYKRKGLLYFSALNLLTIGLVLQMFIQYLPSSYERQYFAVLIVSATLVATQIALTLTNWTATILVKPKRLPRLDFSTGIPEEHATMVAVPTLLTNPKGIQSLLQSIEVNYLGNKDRNVAFALLTDFLDAKLEHCHGDSDLVDQASAGIAALNVKYTNDGIAPFYLFHRSRKWNSDEKIWMGYERKRGKLMEFSELLRGGAPNAFSHITGDIGRLSQFRYIITLDTDTRLPHNAAQQLIAAMAHPLNRPLVDPKTARVVEGYTILQPRVAIELQSADKTRFTRLFAGEPGIDPYTREISDVYQDIFEEGSFVGKGIFDVDTFISTLKGRFPDNWILSHDLIESCVARSGLISDVLLQEQFPSGYQSDVSRRHRWIRGDWQISPWLFPGLARIFGCKENANLSALSRWKIADNLRRSLVPLATLVTLILGLDTTNHAIAWSVYALSVLFLPCILTSTQKLASKGQDSDWRSHLTMTAKDLIPRTAQALLSVIFLPYEAWKSIHAVFCALFRMLIAKRRLLEWRPAHEVERLSEGYFVYYLRSMAPVTVVLLAITWFEYRSESNHALALLFLPLWISAPVTAWWISLPIKKRTQTLNDADRDYLIQVARDTWEYFAKYVNASENWLPPDNVQLLPEKMIAHRTSPTNIGLYLLSALAAYDFGFIGIDQLADKLAATMNTMDRLERFKGHFYNWYDTTTLQPLPPSYVSTVDSGNLTACLFVIGSALDQICEDPSLIFDEWARKRIAELASKARQLGTCDYTFLYNKSRRLLAIGYNVQEQRTDQSYYDLLASEARLASIFGIALGQLPVEHWFALGRLMNRIGNDRILLSWSGSMFEYLMPQLILPDYEHTLLYETHRAAVRYQIEYGKLRGVPWGVSESGYFATDTQSNYQYRAFGVPGLGLKRGLGNDVVVAPYASMLALTVAPQAACENLRRMERDGFRAEFGFYEAIDFTTNRIPPQQDYAIVHSFMAHHQGMGFLGLAYALLDQPMQRRFLRSPLLKSVAILLEESSPKTAPFPIYGTETPDDHAYCESYKGSIRVINEPLPAEPSIQLLSNGDYHVMVDAAGGGYSAVGDMLINRYRPDSLRRDYGCFLFLRNLESGGTWSSAFEPTQQSPGRYEVVFTDGKAEFKRRDGSIETRTEIAVSPEHNLEVRRTIITNRGRSVCEIEATSFVELALANIAADQAHPAFSKLFLKTEIIASHDGILCQRRTRSEDEPTRWAFNVLIARTVNSEPASFETDRVRFIGRGNSVHDPSALKSPLSGCEGYVLDPAFAIRRKIRLKPSETVTVDFVLGEAKDKSQALDLMASFQEKNAADRVFELAWAHSHVILQQLNIDAAKAQLFNRMAGYLVFPHASMRAPARILLHSHPKGQAGLWGYGISGEIPIMLVKISQTSQIPLLREMVIAHTYFRRKGLATDLIIWNEDQTSYRQQLQDEIQAAIAHMGTGVPGNTQGGIFVIRPDQILQEDRKLLLAAARLIINAQEGLSLYEQIQHRVPIKKSQPTRTANRVQPLKNLSKKESPERGEPLPGLNTEGTEFVINLSESLRTPMPWVNVLANHVFGTIISERGSSYTWYENCHEFRLTQWHNDPVCDPAGEAFYIQDEQTGLFWSPMPWPTAGNGSYIVRHGFGYSVFEHTSSGIHSETWVFTDKEEPVKYTLIKLKNLSERRRKINLIGVCEWVLGDYRQKNAMHIFTETDNQTVFARNTYLMDNNERIAFFGCASAQSISADRAEILGELGDWASPAALRLKTLSGRMGCGLDPCAGIKTTVELEAGASREVVFVLGAAPNRQLANDLAKITTTLRPPAKVLREVRQAWRDTLSKVKITTPDASVNALANGWLLYQTMSSRLFARSGFYQSGGAFGFRDQLQDVLALLHHEPSMARAHILRCAKQQFVEGDVLHWWHPPGGRGIRTRFSDDYLWLPYVTARYIESTGDDSILNEQISFLEGQALKSGEESHYGRPRSGDIKADLYDHCVRAIKYGLKAGAHNLPLMGCGDWNDGMNLVGIKGRGESVWLGFFLFDVLRRFKTLVLRRGDTDFDVLCDQQMDRLKNSLDQNAWDGEWYLRAFDDDGGTLGSKSDDECKIDLLPQAWSVISEAGEPNKTSVAMDSVYKHLVNQKDGIIQLFDPPFEFTRRNPGYIKGYPPGIRENGGQYTHAAIWAAWAFAKMGDGGRAWELFELMNPLRHARDWNQISIYKGEPYVVAADVYSKAPHVGRAGWTWYTGAAGWMYQLLIEQLLGLVREGDTLRLKPLLHPDWDAVHVDYRYHSTHYGIAFSRTPSDVPGIVVLVDGVEQSNDVIRLNNDGVSHKVLCEVRTPKTISSAEL
jgi:cyclic beta-1,2-glucan synthetase